MKVLYFTIHIHTQINQYVVISGFPPVSFCPYHHIVKATFFHFFLSREIYTCHQKPRFIDTLVPGFLNNTTDEVNNRTDCI